MEYSDLDVVGHFLEYANEFILPHMTTFTDSLSAVLGAILTAYLTYKIVFTSLYGGESIKELVSIAVLVMLASIFAQTDTLKEWIIEPFLLLREEMITVFSGGEGATWDVISDGLKQSQQLMTKGSMTNLAPFVYGWWLMLSLIILYVVFASVYLGASVSFLCLVCFGGVVLQLAALPPFRGMFKSYFQALAKYTLICVVAALITNMGIYIISQSIDGRLMNDDGFIGAPFFVIVITVWITILFLPKSAEIVGDLVGGSMSDVAGDAKRGASLIQSAGGMMSTPAQLAAMKTAGASMAGAKAIGASVARALKQSGG